ncbi:hypothetical protein BDF19DRAFT_459774 [Syncephalis fuscata]|nr:hypothetical protein BDF19DRAFT_459774 [Syncephalis fuscata]
MSDPPEVLLEQETLDEMITKNPTTIAERRTAVESLLAAVSDDAHSTPPSSYSSVGSPMFSEGIPSMSNGTHVRGRDEAHSDDDDEEEEEKGEKCDDGENSAPLVDRGRRVETVDVLATNNANHQTVQQQNASSTLVAGKSTATTAPSLPTNGTDTTTNTVSNEETSTTDTTIANHNHPNNNTIDGADTPKSSSISLTAPFSSIFGSSTRTLPISPLAQPPANASQSDTTQNGVNNQHQQQQQLYTPGYHPAELVHMSIYAPNLIISEDNTSNNNEHGNEDISELDKEEQQERQQVIYCYDRVDLLPGSTFNDGNSRNATSPVEGYSLADKQQRQLWNMRLRKIGLARALAEFCGSFTDQPFIDNVHTQRHRWSVIELEPGYWILAEIALGRYVRPLRDDKHKFEVEYSESSVDDACVREILLNGYQSFKLHYGLINNILTQQGRISLNRQLITHFDAAITEWNFDRRDIYAALNGIDYAPMSRTSRLSVDQLLVDIRTRLDQVNHTMLLWRDTLVSSDINDIQDTRTLWHYLVDKYVPTKELNDTKAGYRRGRKMAKKIPVTEQAYSNGNESTNSLYSFWQSSNFLKTITPSFWTRNVTGEPTIDAIASATINDFDKELNGSNERDNADSHEDDDDDEGTSSAVTSPALSREASEGGVSSDRAGSTLLLSSNAASNSLPSITTITNGVTLLGQFLTGPLKLKETKRVTESETDGVKEQDESLDSNGLQDAPPIVYIGSPAEAHHLIIYQYPPELLLVMLIPVAQAPQLTAIEFYRTLRDHMAALVEAVHYRMAHERRGVERVYADRVKNYRFAYLDRQSLAFRSTLSARRIRGDVRECLLRMHETFERDENIRELCDRLSISSRWILARRDARREVYFIVDRKDATLVHVEEEFRRLSAVDLGQIVMDR